MKITAGEIADAAGGRVVLGDTGICVSSISTDSNKIEKGALFVPVIGRRVDAHRFIGGAIRNGASVSFTSEELPEELMRELKEADGGTTPGGSGRGPVPEGCAVIRVEDTVRALQAFAGYYREEYVRIPYVGVTGSVGKTTTREMTACALGAGFRHCYSTKGNANSQTGVPITVAATPEDADVGVIEMGISEFGEMERLSGIVKCDAAIVTVIDISHIAQLKSRENIMREKLHIADGMPDGGRLLVNADDDLLGGLTMKALHGMGIAMGKELEIRGFGTSPGAWYRAEDIREGGAGLSSFDLYIAGKRRAKVRLTVPGRHMVMNALAALAAADTLGVDPEEAAQRLNGFTNLEGRGRELTAGGVRIINDAYNASPLSMKAGLKVLDSALDRSRDNGNGGRRIAVLGDMLELGEDEAACHTGIGDFIVNETHIDMVFACGELAKNIVSAVNRAGKGAAEAAHFPDYETLYGYLRSEVRSGDVLLFKASNSMKLWKMAGELAEELSRTGLK